MATLVLLNNFLHDFCAAGWLFGAVVLWLVLRKPNHIEDTERFIFIVLNRVLLLMRFCLAGIVIFGVFRVMAYREYEWNEAAGESQITLLIVKHIILSGLFAVGLVCYIRARKFVKKVQREN